MVLVAVVDCGQDALEKGRHSNDMDFDGAVSAQNTIIFKFRNNLFLRFLKLCVEPSHLRLTQLCMFFLRLNLFKAFPLHPCEVPSFPPIQDFLFGTK